MGFKWNDTTERMVLLKFVEQHINEKLNANAALAAWPSDIEAPTQRGLTDRFNSIKRQIKESRVVSSLGQGGVSLSIDTPQPVPRTPKSNPAKKVKAESSLDIDSVDQNDDTPSGLSRRTQAPKITASSTLRSRLQSANSAPKSHNKSSSGQKRKHRGSDEESTTECEETDEAGGSADEANAAADKQSPSEARRSLPRRSKSMTPARYRVDVESTNSETDAADHDVVDDGHASKKPKVYGTDKRDAEQGVVVDNDDGESDGSFDPVAHRTLENDGSKKRKATWQERIAMVDGGDEEDEFQA